ncbi:hypothetical protein RUA4292_02657 [Ruegeria atlantica]|uniref:Uncharacterized protein n=1 Tax=Ruegeria atlantica TaxID=81569 RepID=A0A0P1EFI3_9RHOB|nr:hypothetical protein RUA4292_02657 [Ruegeria atlantica]
MTEVFWAIRWRSLRHASQLQPFHFGGAQGLKAGLRPCRKLFHATTSSSVRLLVERKYLGVVYAMALKNFSLFSGIFLVRMRQTYTSISCPQNQ